MVTAERICANLTSILRQNGIAYRCEEDEIASNVFSIDIDLDQVDVNTAEKLIRVAEKYKGFKDHTTVGKNLRLIFDLNINEKHMIITKFEKFVNEKFGNEEVWGNGNAYIRTDRSETKTQKIVYPVNEYEIGERVQVSIYAKDKKRAGETGIIVKPTKLMEGQVCIEFKDGKKDYFLTTEINRI